MLIFDKSFGINTGDDTGTTINNQDITITENGEYTAEDGYTGIGTATVNVTPTVESLSITPSTSQQTFNSSDVDGYKPVVVDAVTNSIDANIVPGNIKKDVEILGVTGTFKGPDEVSVINGTGAFITEGQKVWLNKDKQNFTIAGSPTVDNIYKTATGFTASNYLSIGTLNLNSASSWVMQIKIKTGSDVTTLQNILVENRVNFDAQVMVDTGKIVFKGSFAHSAYDFTLTSTTSAVANTEYLIKLEFTGSAYNLYINGTLEDSYTSSTKLLDWVWNIGASNNSSSTYAYPFAGTVYLDTNTFITIDGSTAWTPYIWGYSANDYNSYIINGTNNGTSLTTPEMYKTLGSNSNYINLPEVIHFGTADTWEIVAKVYLTASSSNGMLFSSSNNTYETFYIFFNGYTPTVGGGGIDQTSMTSSQAIAVDTLTWLKVKFTGTAYEMYLSTDGNNYTLTASWTSSTKVTDVSNVFTVGHSVSTSSFYVKGRIYLKGTYINVNSERVWNGLVVGENTLSTIPVDTITGYATEDAGEGSTFVAKTLLEG